MMQLPSSGQVLLAGHFECRRVGTEDERMPPGVNGFLRLHPLSCEGCHSYSMFVTVHCPQCNDETEHEVVAESRDLLVRCMSCGHHQRIQKEREPPVFLIKPIVSREGTSRVCGIEFAEEDECNAGDHLVAECGDDAFGVEVTAIECGDKRMKQAKAPDITTLWTRAIEQVVVKISIHDGRKTDPGLYGMRRGTTVRCR